MPTVYYWPMRMCPCGSGLVFSGCCGPLLDGQPAATAEALMRSRYSAFATRNANHLYRTWHPRTRPVEIRPENGVTWTGLRILETVEGDHVGTVTFEADWAADGRRGTLREASRFERRAGRWFYVDGDANGT